MTVMKSRSLWRQNQRPLRPSTFPRLPLPPLSAPSLTDSARADPQKKPIVLDVTPEPDLPKKATPVVASKKQTPQSSAKKASVAKRKVLDSSDEEDVKPKKRQSLGGRSTKKNYAESSEDEEEDVKPKPKTKAKKEPSVGPRFPELGVGLMMDSRWTLTMMRTKTMKTTS